MKKINADNIILGCIAGLIVPAIAYIVYFAIVYFFHLRRVNVSICMVANLIPFYLSMNREKYNFTKGVILITVVLAIVITAMSYFTNFFKILQ